MFQKKLLGGEENGDQAKANAELLKSSPMQAKEKHVGKNRQSHNGDAHTQGDSPYKWCGHAMLAYK